MFALLSTDRSFFYSGAGSAFADIEVDVAGRNWITFQARTCNNMFVALWPTTGDSSSSSVVYEIGFARLFQYGSGYNFYSTGYANSVS